MNFHQIKREIYVDSTNVAVIKLCVVGSKVRTADFMQMRWLSDIGDTY